MNVLYFGCMLRQFTHLFINFTLLSYVAFTGWIQIYSRTGKAVQVSPGSSDVVLSENVRGATTFQLVGCRARDRVPDTLRPRCVSLKDASRSGSYVRHDGSFLRLDAKSNTAVIFPNFFVSFSDYFLLIVFSYEFHESGFFLNISSVLIQTRTWTICCVGFA